MIETARNPLITLGMRLVAFRESLDPRPCSGKHVTAYAMERAGGLKRGRWRIAEQEQRPTPQAIELALNAVRRVLSALEITTEQATETMRFVESGEGALPWESPPGWREGLNPNLKTGRGAGVKEERPRRARGSDERTPPPAPPPPSGGARITTWAEVTARAIELLRDVKAQRIEPEQAVLPLGLLFGGGRGSPGSRTGRVALRRIGIRTAA